MAAPRYVKEIARTLIKVAVEKDAVQTVMQDLKQVEAAFALDTHLAVDLDETSVPLEQRRHALTKAITERVHPFVLNTLLALQTRGLLEYLSLVRAAAIHEAKRQANYQEARVTSATPLSSKQLRTLTEQLTERFGGTIDLDHHIDPNLVGGLTATVGDWHIDSSITGKLERLAHALYV